MKRLLSALLLLCLVLSLCACGQPDTQVTKENVTTEPETENTTEDLKQNDGMATYKVTVTDEGGNPISGAFVQICLNDCFPGSTDENGVATFSRPEAEGYKVSFISMPAGFEYSGEETEFYYEGSSKEMTIVLKAVA